MRTFGIVVLASSLVACAIPEEDFPSKYGTAACKRLEECDKGDYESVYGDDDAECVDDFADIADIFLDLGDLAGETYDPTKGRECISNLRSASCEDLNEGNADCDVWED